MGDTFFLAAWATLGREGLLMSRLYESQQKTVRHSGHAHSLGVAHLTSPPPLPVPLRQMQAARGGKSLLGLCVCVLPLPASPGPAQPTPPAGSGHGAGVQYPGTPRYLGWAPSGASRAGKSASILPCLLLTDWEELAAGDENRGPSTTDPEVTRPWCRAARVHGARVGRPDITLPELQGKKYRSVPELKYTAEHLNCPQHHLSAREMPTGFDIVQMNTGGLQAQPNPAIQSIHAAKPENMRKAHIILYRQTCSAHTPCFLRALLDQLYPRLSSA